MSFVKGVTSVQIKRNSRVEMTYDDSFGSALFGTGADGDLVYDGTTAILGVSPSNKVYTLARDIYADNLTINSGVSIITAGYRIFVRKFLLNNGTIKWNGTDASADTAGTALAAKLFGASSAGAAGGTGNGTAGNASAKGVGGTGGAGGAGQTAGGGTAGTSATATPPTAAEGGIQNIYTTAVLRGTIFASTTKFTGGDGGAAGGGDGTSGKGGGGGAGGGIVVIAAKVIDPNGTGDIQAKGGAGGAGVENAGGGGGGGGGVVAIITANPVPTPVSAGKPGQTISVAGGAGGAKGSGTGTTAGSAGGAGRYVEIRL